MTAFSFCHWADSAPDFSFKLASSDSSFCRRSRLASSFSLASDVRSIWYCRIWRSNRSNSVGLESSSIFNREADSSTKSTALSGKNRSLM